MINFRFHLVSLISVFLALTAGIVIGSTVVDPAVVDGLRNRIDAAEARADRISDDNAELRSRAGDLTDELDALPEQRRVDRLCELNVAEQVTNVCQTTIVCDAWTRGQELTVHGLVYGLQDGLLRDLGVSVSGAA